MLKKVDLTADQIDQAPIAPANEIAGRDLHGYVIRGHGPTQNRHGYVVRGRRPTQNRHGYVVRGLPPNKTKEKDQDFQIRKS
ncbi:MAG: hypothetical protein PUF82_03525 [Lactobacillus equicursoris]|uniref:hypothetical protein n=1 Tax=Lactobacillus equicursoris TaxID=420645 RepID=UPI002432630F|nr:hypothetical protein [Lactobacillus equicursoris]MDD6407066.1 hypothetical protein [Lactobacillus equicursoris]